jgi:acetyl-CoA synthetase
MSETLENLSSETRQFPPPEELAARANVTGDRVRAGRG